MRVEWNERETWTGGTILIVDDDPAFRNALVRLLRILGRKAEVVAGGDEALDYLRISPPPSLILVDLLMPSMKGEELIQKIQLNREWSRIPIVVLSGSARAPDWVRSTPSVRGLLAKPFDMEELESVLQNAASG